MMVVVMVRAPKRTPDDAFDGAMMMVVMAEGAVMMVVMILRELHIRHFADGALLFGRARGGIGRPQGSHGVRNRGEQLGK
jgi:hypothetical protein